VLVDIVRLGRDTDTNGAVAGGLLGARDGADTLPPDWRTVVQFADEFVRSARLLFAHRSL
jgi:ADP-ribosylglycohydrolase